MCLYQVAAGVPKDHLQALQAASKRSADLVPKANVHEHLTKSFFSLESDFQDLFYNSVLSKDPKVTCFHPD